jgi:rhodanese-related sulfurtransferase
MDSNKIALFVAIMLVVYMLLSRRGGIAPAEAKRLVKEGAKLIDVRSPGEFASGHIEGAKNVPVQELDARINECGPKGGHVIVYCASGMRSASAARTLRSAGYTKVADLGAMSRW